MAPKVPLSLAVPAPDLGTSGGWSTCYTEIWRPPYLLLGEYTLDHIQDPKSGLNYVAEPRDVGLSVEPVWIYLALAIFGMKGPLLSVPSRDRVYT